MSSKAPSLDLRVSIIMRTRDRPVLLRRAVRSVMGQTCRDWQLVIVNDGDRSLLESTLLPFAGELEGRLQIVESPGAGTPPHIGRLTNAGILASQSSFITLLDDDDTWHPRFLEKTLHRLESGRRHPDVRGVACQSQWVEDSVTGDEIREHPADLFNPHLTRIELLALATSNLFTCNAFLYERSALETVGLYREDLPVLDDWDFNFRFASHFDIDVVSEALANYHRRPAANPDSSSANTPLSMHDFYHTKLVNDHLRKDLQSGSMGAGWLMAIGGRLRSMSDKIGKVERRTRGDGRKE